MGGEDYRDDLRLSQGKPTESLYSRLEMVVPPKGGAPIIELIAKGTIRNREVFSRRHYQYLDDSDIANLALMISQWTVEYAELFAAQQ